MRIKGNENEKDKEIRKKIKDIINEYGESTSESGIYWEDETRIWDKKRKRNIIIEEHPLDIIVDEILELFDN